jgi:hypothetical protein
MTAKFFACKYCPVVDGRPLQFHEDDKEDYIEHLAAHGVDTSALADTPWWDEEAGFSISPTDRVRKETPVARTQFGDGSEPQVRENARKWHDLKALEAISTHDTPASAFIGAKVIKTKTSKSAFAPSVAVKGSLRSPAAGKPLLTASSVAALKDLKVVDVQQPATVSSRIEKKGSPVMATTLKSRSKATEENPYADAPVVNLTVGAGVTSAPRVCITTGVGFKDVAAIQSIMTLLQKAHPNAVVTNQGRWEGDKLVANIARQLGLGYEMSLPKFLEARQRGNPLFDVNHRMTPAENAEVGYQALQHDIAEKCIELHVFGTASGPQRGLIEAFAEVDKHCYSWGSSTDEA